MYGLATVIHAATNRTIRLYILNTLRQLRRILPVFEGLIPSSGLP